MISLLKFSSSYALTSVNKVWQNIIKFQYIFNSFNNKFLTDFLEFLTQVGTIENNRKSNTVTTFPYDMP